MRWEEQATAKARTIRTVLLICCICGLCLPVRGATIQALVPVPMEREPARCWGLAGMETVPSLPTAQDPVTVRIWGEWTDSCAPKLTSYEVDGNVIHLRARVPPLAGGCAAVITAWEVVAKVGYLADGLNVVQWDVLIEDTGWRHCGAWPLYVWGERTSFPYVAR